MTNLVTSTEASVFEKPTAADIADRKEADESGECDAYSLLIRSHTTNKGASAIFGINGTMTRLG
jgi:hypothetical protein